MSLRVDSIQAVDQVNCDSWVVRIGQRLAPVILAVSDYLVIVLALKLAVYLRSECLPSIFPTLFPFYISEKYLLFVIPLFYLLILTYEGMYTRRLPLWQSIERLFRVCTIVTIITIVTIYFLKSGSVSRIFMFFSGMFCFISLAVSRYSMKCAMVKLGLWQKPVVIVGAGKTAEILAKTFEEEPSIGYKIAGLIEDEGNKRPLTRYYPHIGNFDNAAKVIQASGIQDVILATPGLEREKLLSLIYEIQPCVKNLTIVPNLFGIPLCNMEVGSINNEKTLLLKMRNNMMVWHNRWLKRVFDFSGSIFGGICILPILVGIAAAIYIDSPGPVVFAHKRIGKNGKSFPCYKFRSMIPNAQQVLEVHLAENPAAREEWERDFKLKDDPRITRVGKFLRRTSLDELPQLLNVIRGEMSLVGPRPIVHKEIEKYGQYIADYLLVAPGMTGFWQVNGRNDVSYETRVQMDSWYVRNWSLWQDVLLLIKTIGVVAGKKGAY